MVIQTEVAHAIAGTVKMDLLRELKTEDEHGRYRDYTGGLYLYQNISEMFVNLNDAIRALEKRKRLHYRHLSTGSGMTANRR